MYGRVARAKSMRLSFERANHRVRWLNLTSKRLDGCHFACSSAISLLGCSIGYLGGGGEGVAFDLDSLS
jgi:hypothetical protein